MLRKPTPRPLGRLKQIMLICVLSALFTSPGMAAAAASGSYATYLDPLYGYSIQYPATWHTFASGAHVVTFALAAPTVCQVNISVAPSTSAPPAALGAVVPADAGPTTRTQVDGEQAIRFAQTPRRMPGVTGKLDAGRETVAVAQPNRGGGSNVYVLTLLSYATSIPSAACGGAFDAMVQSLQLPRPTGGQPVNVAPNALTNPGDPAVSYAEGHWSWCYWNSATDSSDPNGCTSAGSQSGKFECAEFVARSLANKGLIPNLTPSSTPSQYANYQYPGNGRYYNLLNVGTVGTVNGDYTYNGLYQFLIDSGTGEPVGDNPAAAVPGDPVFYYNGTPPMTNGTYNENASNREHTALLVATGTTRGGTDTLIDEHNDPGYHWYYNSPWSGNLVIVHITGNSGSGATQSQFFGMVGTDRNLYYKNGGLSSAWIVGPSNTAALAFSGSRIGYLDQQSNFYVEDTSVSNPSWNYESSGKAIALSGSRIGIMQTNGDVYVKDGALDAAWTYEANANSFALTTNPTNGLGRVGVLEGTTFYMKEGSLGAGWTQEATNVSAIALSGSRVAYLDQQGNMYVKDDSLANPSWMYESSGKAIALAGTRIGLMQTNGDVYVKDGALDAAWVYEANASAFAISSNRVGVLEGSTFYVKEGDLGSSWVTESAIGHSIALPDASSAMQAS